MAPIYESDVAEGRWAKDEWRQFELWEKVELRLARRKRLWIAGTLVVFVLLSSFPILMDRWPRWTAFRATRQLAQEINRIKRDAGISHQAYRIVFDAQGRLEYRVERLNRCADGQSDLIRTGRLMSESRLEHYTMVSPGLGSELGIPGLVNSFCYDPLTGSGREDVAGFAVIPAKDLTDRRADRLSVLLLNGISAEISFD